MHFGEEVIVENAEMAITKACEATGAVMSNFTAKTGLHRSGENAEVIRLIEFAKKPGSHKNLLIRWTTRCEASIQNYDAKREKIRPPVKPVVHAAEEGTFTNGWRGAVNWEGRTKFRDCLIHANTWMTFWKW